MSMPRALPLLILDESAAGQLRLRHVGGRREHGTDVIAVEVVLAKRHVVEAGLRAPLRALHEHVGARLVNRDAPYITGSVLPAGPAQPPVEHRFQAQAHLHTQCRRTLMVMVQIAFAVPVDRLFE